MRMDRLNLRSIYIVLKVHHILCTSFEFFCVLLPTLQALIVKQCFTVTQTSLSSDNFTRKLQIFGDING